MIAIEHNPELHDALAAKVRAELENDPHLTVGALAQDLDAEEGDVALVLDRYLCHDDRITYEGPGLGGNWVPTEVQEATYVAGEGIFIGYRQPDGTLADTPYLPPTDETESPLA